MLRGETTLRGAPLALIWINRRQLMQVKGGCPIAVQTIVMFNERANSGTSGPVVPDPDELLRKAAKPTQDSLRLHPIYRGKIQILP